MCGGAIDVAASITKMKSIFEMTVGETPHNEAKNSNDGPIAGGGPSGTSVPAQSTTDIGVGAGAPISQDSKRVIRTFSDRWERTIPLETEMDRRQRIRDEKRAATMAEAVAFQAEAAGALSTVGAWVPKSRKGSAFKTRSSPAEGSSAVAASLSSPAGSMQTSRQGAYRHRDYSAAARASAGALWTQGERATNTTQTAAHGTQQDTQHQPTGGIAHTDSTVVSATESTPSRDVLTDSATTAASTAVLSPPIVTFGEETLATSNDLLEVGGLETIQAFSSVDPRSGESGTEPSQH